MSQRVNERRPTKPGRPPEFDALVMQWLPAMHRESRQLVRGGEAQNDLVTDTIITALHRWSTYRNDGNVWVWLRYIMRGVARQDRRVSERMPVADNDNFLRTMPAEPRQEDIAAICQAVDRIDGRDLDVLLDAAQGNSYAEIAAERGITKQRVGQIVQRARAAAVGAT